jgi:hypothetical protein
METAILELGDGIDTNRALLEELDLSNPELLANNIDLMIERLKRVVNLLAEVDAMANAILGGAKYLKLQLGKLGTNVALLAVPLVPSSGGIPDSLSLGREVVVVDRLSLSGKVSLSTSSIDAVSAIRQNGLNVARIEGVGYGSLTSLGVTIALAGSRARTTGRAPTRHVENVVEASYNESSVRGE